MNDIFIMNPEDDQIGTNYDHTNANSVASRIAKAHPNAFRYYNNQFLRGTKNDIYFAVEGDKFFIDLLTDNEKQYWKSKLGKLKKELIIYYTRPED